MAAFPTPIERPELLCPPAQYPPRQSKNIIRVLMMLAGLMMRTLVDHSLTPERPAGPSDLSGIMVRPILAP